MRNARLDEAQAGIKIAGRNINNLRYADAAAAAKSLQSCLTLCDPIDGSLPGSAIPGILQVRTRVDCHFLLQCMKVKSESEVAQSCPTLRDPMDCPYQAPPSIGFSRQEYWSGVPLPSWKVNAYLLSIVALTVAMKH